MQDAEPKEGASGNGKLVNLWVGFTLQSQGVHRCFSFQRGGSFKLRLGTRRFGDSFHFFFTRDEFQLSCLQKGKALWGDARRHYHSFL